MHSSEMVKSATGPSIPDGEMFSNKQVLVTGGTGMIGRFLCQILLQQGAKVRVASLDSEHLCPEGCQFFQRDLTLMENCLEVTEGVDFVFHLAGVKGSPVAAVEKPASFFTPLLLFNTNMLEASRRNAVGGYLYTSSIGVYNPDSGYIEDKAWELPPSDKDYFAGWAKRMGELQLDAYRKQYQWDDLYCVRPANVYGEYDNFDSENAMVIPSLIKRALQAESELVVWGDGSAVRDFIHAEDVAYAMLHVVKNKLHKPVNLGCGSGVSIKQLAEAVVAAVNPKLKLEWDVTKPNGDPKRILDTARLQQSGYRLQVDLPTGIRRVVDWYRHRPEDFQRPSYF